MKRVFLLFFVFFTLLTTQAQSKFVYEALQSAGPVPADFAYYLDKGDATVFIEFLAKFA